MSGAAQSFILSLTKLSKTSPSNTEEEEEEEEERKKNNHKGIKRIKRALDTILLQCPQDHTGGRIGIL